MASPAAPVVSRATASHATALARTELTGGLRSAATRSSTACWWKASCVPAAAVALVRASSWARPTGRSVALVLRGRPVLTRMRPGRPGTAEACGAASASTASSPRQGQRDQRRGGDDGGDRSGQGAVLLGFGGVLQQCGREQQQTPAAGRGCQPSTEGQDTGGQAGSKPPAEQRCARRQQQRQQHRRVDADPHMHPPASCGAGTGRAPALAAASHIIFQQSGLCQPDTSPRNAAASCELRVVTKRCSTAVWSLPRASTACICWAARSA